MMEISIDQTLVDICMLLNATPLTLVLTTVVTVAGEDSRLAPNPLYTPVQVLIAGMGIDGCRGKM